MKKLFLLLIFLSCSVFVNAQSLLETISGESQNDQSGYSVSMPDANTVAIGAPFNDGNGSNSGHVRIYSFNGSSWTQKGLDIDGEASSDQSGYSVSMPDANTVAIGAQYNNPAGSNNKGHVRVYRWNGSSWIQRGLDIDGSMPSDRSGFSVSMPDSNTVAIGAPYNDVNGSNSGHVRIYSWNGNGWVQKGADINGESPNDRFGYSISMPDSNTLAISAPWNDGTGHVRIYTWNGNGWVQKGADIDGSSPSDRFGYFVTMPDSNTIAISAPFNDDAANNAGQVRIYSWNGSNWTLSGNKINGQINDEIGYSLSMPNSNIVAIGSPYASSSGNVTVYSLKQSIWQQEGIDMNLNGLNQGSGWSVSMPNPQRLSFGSPDLGSVSSGTTSIYDLSFINIPLNSSGCIECIGFETGQIFNSNGDSILVVDRQMLDSLINLQYDLSKVCVSNIQDFSSLNLSSTFNDNIQLWDVQNALDMSFMFNGASSFNQKLKKWDVQNVVNMSFMFNGASSFNKDLSDWNISSVRYMNSMFKDAKAFNNQNRLISWNTSNVTDMSSMFEGASSFNQNIQTWNTSNVTDMSSMFEGASSFNQNIQAWNTLNVTDMSSMFEGANNFDQNIQSWNTSNVTDMSMMFLFATSFNRPLWTWKVNNVSNMNHMFHFASSFNQDLTSWCVDTFATEPIGFALNSPLAASNKPTWGSCREAFINASNCLECDQFAVGEWFSNGDSILVVDRAMLDSIISGTNYQLDYVCVSQVTNLDSLFEGQTIRGGIDAWDVSNVTSMVGTFAGQSNFNQDIGNWDVSNVTDMSHMFSGNSAFNQDIGDWDLSAVNNIANLFFQAENFNRPLNNWDVSNVTDMSYIFVGAKKFNQDIGNWNVVQVTDMNYAFFFATDFNQDIGNWDTRNVTGMNSMFLQAQSFDQDLKPWCMSKIGSEPTGFALNSGLQANNYPRWGVCEAVPGVFINSLGCIECDSLNVGDFFVLDGDSIEVVDRTRLLALVAAQGDLTKVCVSHVQNMKNIFRGAKWFNQDITKWDMSNVTNTVNMFFNAETFNQDLSTWDVSSVTNMTGMFFRADSFNQNLNVWDVSQVTGMSRMFGEAASFNGKIDQWDVSGVNRMTEMLKDATSFNQDLSSWCVSNFEYNAPTNFALNSPLLPAHYPIWGNCPTPYGDNVLALATGAFIDSSGCVDCSALNVGDYFTLGGDTMLVVDRPMLDSLVILRRDLSKVCVSHITDMKDALRGLRWFNTDISGWDVSNVTDMTNMFFKSKIFNQEIGNWNVSSVTNMNRMFQKAESFNGDLSDWDVSNVTKMNATFFGAAAFNQDIGDWDVGNVTVAEAMFRNAGAFSQDLSMWCVTNIAAQPNLFDWNAALTSSQLPVWGTCPTPPPYEVLPNGCISCAGLNIGDQFTLNGINYTVVDRPMLDSMVTGNHDISKACVSHVTEMDFLFAAVSQSNYNPNISNWDVSNVNNMAGIFYNKDYFNSDIGAWDVSSVTNMNYMFFGADRFNQDIGQWDVSSVQTMKEMFSDYNNSSAQLNIGSWDVSSVTDMSYMFYDARSFNQNIGSWDVSSVTDMSHMFMYPAYHNFGYYFNQDIGDWDVSNVTNMRYMFYGTRYFNQDIGDWNVGNVTNMTSMFKYTYAFNQNLSNWCVSQISSTPSEFSFSGPLIPPFHPQWGQPCASPSIAAVNQTDWNTNSTIDGQGNALNLTDGNGISIYPNPTTGIINLDPVPEGTYRLYNEIGRLMDQGKIQPRFDLSNFDNGIYMLLLQTENESKYFKVIKQ